MSVTTENDFARKISIKFRQLIDEYSALNITIYIFPKLINLITLKVMLWHVSMVEFVHMSG